MTDNELLTRIQKETEKTAEFILHQDATEELVFFLGKHLPRERMGEVGKLLESYGQTAGNMAQKMLHIAEELADSE